ncbi:hypothetical protein [Singulisphaera sp. PoT]|uniref:hypothetical protein n=1 Tax=Singulisphaera sp. PoT TaxID=3411797 RepID=UPI003BF479A1
MKGSRTTSLDPSEFCLGTQLAKLTKLSYYRALKLAALGQLRVMQTGGDRTLFHIEDAKRHAEEIRAKKAAHGGPQAAATA